MHEAGPPLPRRGWRSTSTFLAAAVFSTAATCYTCPPPPEPPSPVTGGIYLIPPTAWVSKGQQFTVRARILDGSGVALSDAAAAAASWTSDLASFTPQTAASVQVTAPSTGTFPQTHWLDIALAPYATARFTFYVTDGVAPATVDWIAAKHQAGEPPTIALVDGRTTGPVADMVIGFVGTGAMDYLTCLSSAPKCGEVTLFSRVQRIHRQAEMVMTDGCESLDLATGATFPAGCSAASNNVGDARPLPVTGIYVLASDAPLSVTDDIPPDGIARMDHTYAQTVLAGSWTGLVLDAPVVPMMFKELSITLGDDNSCTGSPSVRQQLEAAGVPVASGKITVAYVAKLLKVDGVTEITGISGATCPWEARDAPGIVLISWSQWLGTTLAHELLHAVGPWNEWPWGHTNGIDGFNFQNIMWEGEDPTTTAPRSLLTLGQAFRFSLDSYSIFHRTATSFPPGGTYYCQAISSTDETPCPRLTKDAVRP